MSVLFLSEQTPRSHRHAGLRYHRSRGAFYVSGEADLCKSCGEILWNEKYDGLLARAYEMYKKKRCSPQVKFGKSGRRTISPRTFSRYSGNHPALSSAMKPERCRPFPTIA